MHIWTHGRDSFNFNACEKNGLTEMAIFEYIHRTYETNNSKNKWLDNVFTVFIYPVVIFNK